MTELWIKAFGVSRWTSADVWLSFYSQAEELLSAKLTNLDTNDPPRRKVKRSEFDTVGNFTASFEDGEDTRWIFGRFKDARVEFTLHHHKNDRKQTAGFPNSLSVFFDERFVSKEDGLAVVESIFDLVNRVLSPFYSFADLRSIVANKKKPSGAVNLQEELLGVFWLTHFGQSYVEFWKRDCLEKIKGVYFENNGVKIKLGSDALHLSESVRSEAERILGKDSFVDPKSTLSKRIGESVLSFDRLA